MSEHLGNVTTVGPNNIISIGPVDIHVLSLGMTILMGIAFFLALLSERPRRPFRRWFLDFMVKWGLAGIFVWFVIHGFWALRELLNMRLVLPFSPLEGYLEYVTVWSAVLTAIATFIFLGSAILLNAIFDRPVVPRLLYQKIAYMDNEVIYLSQSMVVSRQQSVQQVVQQASQPVQIERKTVQPVQKIK